MKRLKVLMVEDNEGDIFLTLNAFEESSMLNEIKVLKDGEAAIHFFEKLVYKKDYPDLILLDINLPKVGGHEVLNYLKTNEKFQQIPVIMLTTSSAERDLFQCYKHHVNCYIIKPLEVDDFIKAMGKIADFWTNVVSLPE